jgi:hypothetical protein
MGPVRPAAKHKNVISLMNMVKALQLAMTKAAAPAGGRAETACRLSDRRMDNLLTD